MVYAMDACDLDMTPMVLAQLNLSLIGHTPPVPVTS